MIEFTCRDCGCQYSGGPGSPKRCGTCQKAYVAYRLIGSGQTHALAEISKAKRKGYLQPASTHACADCGAAAQDYEHRDYDKPLDVVAVCRSCNALRGPAKRKSWTFDEFFAYFNTLRGYAHFRLTKDDFKHIRAKYWPEESVTQV